MKKQFPPGRGLLICLALLAQMSLRAQMLTPTVIASTGGFSSNGNGSLSYTVGEMTMVQTFSASGNILTQGFQQPNETVTGLVEVAENGAGSFVVYPNPAVDNLWYGFQFAETGRVTVDLYDALGQKLSNVYQANYETGKTVETLSTSAFAAGSYFLHVNFTGAETGNEQMITRKFIVIR